MCTPMMTALATMIIITIVKKSGLETMLRIWVFLILLKKFLVAGGEYETVSSSSSSCLVTGAAVAAATSYEYCEH